MKILKIMPHGFCAGVQRAVDIVEKTIDKFPEKKIYVKHEIVHNDKVVSHFKQKGVTFIEDIETISKNDVLIFSAHGVSENFKKSTSDKSLFTIDATCPLVEKVHNYIKNHDIEDNFIIIIGDKDHVEVLAVWENISNAGKIIIKKNEDIENLDISEKYKKIHCITQTTLSQHDTVEIIELLKKKYSNLIISGNGNICYATTNRQDAVLHASKYVDFILVIGGKNSSNSNKLVHTARSKGIQSILISDINEIDFSILEKYESIGITSGASTPEYIFNETVDLIEKYFHTKSEYFTHKKEDVLFILPKILR